MAVLRDLDPRQKGFVQPGIFRGPFRGMRPDVDPQALGPANPYLLINHRLEGGIWVLRGGQKLLCNLGGKVTGLHDHQLGAARSLFLIMDGCPGIDPVSGGSLGIYDQEQVPAYQNAAYYGSATSNIQAALFGTDLLFGVDEVLKKFSSTDSLQETRLQLPAAYEAISAMIEHEGVLLIGAVGDTASGVGTSAVFTFDGVTLTNVLGAINVVQGFGLYRDKAVAIFDGTPNSVRVRTAAGAWGAPVAPGAGTVKVPAANACTSYKDKLYIPNGDSDLFTYDEAGTLTQIAAATNGVSAGAHIMGTAKFEGYLFYLWHDAGETNVYIGRFDGTTWEPQHKDLTGQIFASEPVSSRSIRNYRAALWVAAVTSIGEGNLYSSVRDDTDGNWVQVTDDAFNAGDIRELLVY